MTAIIAGEPFVGVNITRGLLSIVTFEFAAIQQNSTVFKLGHCVLVCGGNHGEQYWSDRLAELSDANQQSVLLSSAMMFDHVHSELTIKIDKQANAISWHVPSRAVDDDGLITRLPLEPFAPALKDALECVQQFFASKANPKDEI